MGSRFPPKAARSAPALAAGTGARPIAALLRAPGDSPTALAPIPNNAPPVVVKPLRRPQFAALLTRPPVHSADVS